MYPVAFDYVRAESVAHALDCLAEPDVESKLLAGGHSLIPMLKLRLAVPEVLVDISGLDELSGVSAEPSGVRIGAAATWRELLLDAGLREAAPLVPEAVRLIGDRQVRARGTIGGSVAHADTAADIPAPLLALDTEVEIAGPAGRRRMALDDFLVGMFQTDLDEAEVLTALTFPVPPPGTAAAYEKFDQPASHLALCGVAAAVTRDGDGRVQRARLAVTGVTGRAFRAREAEDLLVGERLDDRSVAAASERAATGIEPRSDIHADAAYRANLVKVLAGRALRAAAERQHEGALA